MCKWHNLSSAKMKKNRNIKVSLFEKKIFFRNLKKIGYSKFGKIKDNSYEINVVKAFQRKFRQNLINWKIDQECLLISKNLL